ncbi:OsmC family protein [Sporolactobacillus terrae]|uniref:Peroxiredoxin n=1 Tax=Sporolactobacillus terrae TaxID=269673 RepID=A0A410D7U4_9BACL|nr:OsmC family protein [Sporolactobacillus terrae]QAA22132.1 hypothetical protein C0674_05595 [Sporolactobacillus terrae]QAA25104.1 hypothetical protein C0679_05570 [Sporolactobacillus terrae]UAK16924.1 OsmC family protein [Sporolactobacillus terrae]BBN98432.1 hypothetical protein St703_11370 [Sporolactobacillus terrae]
MTDFHFKLKGTWNGSWDGSGQIKTNGLSTVVSVDQSMSGKGIGTNPDELLLGALASCFLITLGIRLDKEKIAYDHIAIQTQGVVTKRGGLHFEKVIHQPTIYLLKPFDETGTDRLEYCIHRAEQDCMIAKAVKGNVQIDIEPKFIAVP